MTTKRPLCNYDGTIKELASDDAVIGAGGLSYSLISTNTQAVSGQGYLINASAGNVTLTLPATPSAGAIVAAVDAYNQSSTNTITLARNGSKIEGLAEDLIFDVDGAGFTLVYVDSTRGWEIVSEIGQGTPEGYDTYHGIESIGTLSFDNSTHVLSVSAVTYWYKGTRYTTTSSVTCDLDLTADRDHASATLTTNTLYYLRFKDATGKLYWSPSFWDLHETVPVATVFWNGSAGSVSKESHGYSRNIDWHIWAHLTVGARYGSGLDKTSPTTSVDGSLQIETGTIYDEDLLVTTGQQTTMRGWYKVSAGVFTFADYALPYLGTSGAPEYLDTDTYALTTFASNRYACFWVFATTDVDRPIAIIPSHISAPYSQLSTARLEVQPSITGVNPEWKLIYRFIYAGDGQFQESVDYRLQTSLAGGVSASTNAGAVSFTPSGNIAATSVQGAIEELDSEKVAHSLATAENDVLVGAPTPFGSWIKKTIAEFKTILGLGSAAYTASTDYDPAGTAAGKIAASISDGDTTHAPDGNSVFDALALKAPNLLTGFTSGAGTVTATDSVLQAVQKLDGNIAAIDGSSGYFDVDVDGGLQPTSTLVSDEYWDVDESGGVMPKASVVAAVNKYYGAVFDGGGSAIAADKKVYVRIPITGTIIAAYIMADVSGTISVEVWKDSFANFPPLVADKISASAPIALSSAQKGEDTTLTGWTTTVTAGDVLCFNVSALATSITWCAVGVVVS